LCRETRASGDEHQAKPERAHELRAEQLAGVAGVLGQPGKPEHPARDRGGACHDQRPRAEARHELRGQPGGDHDPDGERQVSDARADRAVAQDGLDEQGEEEEQAEKPGGDEDAVYHNIPLAPVTGREAIAGTIASVLRPGPPGIESIEFRVINIAASGPVVMTERVDVFKLPDKLFELQVMGIFEVSDGKISAWRDYFDMNQFTSRMG
jgi:limonene-1,2-epoxide hydrolase